MTETKKKTPLVRAKSPLLVTDNKFCPGCGHGIIKRLLAEKPDAKGLVLPGMPMGSPGMEGPEGTARPYTVELVGRDGTTSPFSQH